MIELSTSFRMFQWIGELRSFLDLHEDDADDVHEIALQVYSEIFQFMFEINDDVTRTTARSTTNIVLESLKKDPMFEIEDYYAMCNSINNTPETIDLGKLIVSVAVRLKNKKEFYFNVVLH